MIFKIKKLQDDESRRAVINVKIIEKIRNLEIEKFMAYDLR
jgi:hypothetical protein